MNVKCNIKSIFDLVSFDFLTKQAQIKKYFLAKKQTQNTIYDVFLYSMFFKNKPLSLHLH